MKFKVRPRKWWSLKAWKCAKELERLDNWLFRTILYTASCPECDKETNWNISNYYTGIICLNCCSYRRNNE